MPQPSDCIYCEGETGSREHIFPAALGGRWVNKGILCPSCNEGFSPLDGELARQLQIINGLIGVRADHDKTARPARVGGDTPLLIDHAGTPSLAAPREVLHESLPGHQPSISMEFGSEHQYQKWLKTQRSGGKNVVFAPGRRFTRHYLFAPIDAETSFGGKEVFREVGRIALNFLAHHMPCVARDVGLRPLKDFIQGKRTLIEGEPRHVWYAPKDAWQLPPATSTFGHQVLVRCDGSTGEIFARVNFFSTFDMVVWIGRVSVVPTTAILFDIDPLLGQSTDGVQCRQIDSDPPPATVTPTTDDSAFAVVELLKARTAALLSRIEARHWAVTTAGLLDGINATRASSRVYRSGQVEKLLQPYVAFFVHLAQRVVESISTDDGDEDKQIVAQTLPFLLELDPTSPDGLSRRARISLGLVRARFADLIAREIESTPMSDARLRLLLKEQPGVEEVGQALVDQIVFTLDRCR